MIKVFERDLDALEELSIHLPIKPAMLSVYSDGDFSLTLYTVDSAGQRTAFSAIASGINNDMALKFERGIDGHALTEYLIHGDTDHSTLPVDCEFLPNNVQYIIITANESVTVKWYEY